MAKKLKIYIFDNITTLKGLGLINCTSCNIKGLGKQDKDTCLTCPPYKVRVPKNCRDMYVKSSISMVKGHSVFKKAHTRKPYCREKGNIDKQKIKKTIQDRRDQKWQIEQEAINDFGSGNYNDYDNFISAFDSWYEDHNKELKLLNPRLAEKQLKDKYSKKLGLLNVFLDSDEQKADKLESKIDKEYNKWLESQTIITSEEKPNDYANYYKRAFEDLEESPF